MAVTPARVRTTIRSLARDVDVLAMLRAGGADPGESLSFAAADLTSDAGWPRDFIAGQGGDLELAVVNPGCSGR